MAKRQNFQFGSTTSNIKTMTVSELNNGWEQLSILYSDVLNGTFGAISEYSYDSSQEIANAILSLTGSQPTGTKMTELADALIKMREEIETSSLTFKGYVATSAPSSSTYGLIEGNIWINASAMPTTFPVPASSIRVWNGTSWATTTDTYTVKDFDFFRNINNGEGYYWFGGQWVVMSTDMSTTYFSLNQTTGKWEIKYSVNLPGTPTTTTPTAGDSSTKIATTKFVTDSFAPLNSPALTGTPTAPTPTSADNSTKIATTAWVRANMPSVSQVVPVAAIMPYAGTTAPSGYLMCNGQAVSRTTYSALFSKIGTAYGSGDGSTTFNLPNYTDRVAQGLGRGYLNAGLPNITGSIGSAESHNGVSGCFYDGSARSGLFHRANSGTQTDINFDASRSSSIYGAASTVQPPAVKSYWIIKY